MELLQKVDGVTVTVHLHQNKGIASDDSYADGVRAVEFEDVVDRLLLSVKRKNYVAFKTGYKVLIKGGKVQLNGADRQPG